MQIAAVPAIRSRCPLDHDRQRALFSKFFFFFFENFISDCAGLRIFSSAMRRFLGAMGQSRPSCHQFATAVGAGESRCLCRRRAAVPSMLRDYQQFPTTDGNVEARRRTRPAWREAVPASIAGLDPSPFPMSIAIAISATHASLYIVRRSPAGPCRLEKTLSPAISSGRRRTAPMQIAAGPPIRVRCPHPTATLAARPPPAPAPDPTPASAAASEVPPPFLKRWFV